ncbi:ECF RNA polymerase sigma factor SigD [Aeoliella mucimassa]|uniref:ECF RNA polymerase sigma factor SigD n=1 Tax=Aeoliella mucimassa TaxID=2527972 RepID=A0A518AQ60_9BACT|nr:ECF RNA polymerase sigma factor SigD [Aeoliella mucimassa]
MVLGFIRSTVIDFHKAEDVLQETAATVAEKFEEYDRSRPFVPWVLGIARYKVLEELRANSRDKLVFDDEVVEVLTSAFDELAPSASDTQVALESCLNRIRGRAKQLLEMRYLRQQSVTRVAETTGMTAGAVRVALHRIRKALVDCVHGQLGSDDMPRGASK